MINKAWPKKMPAKQCKLAHKEDFLVKKWAFIKANLPPEDNVIHRKQLYSGKHRFSFTFQIL